MNTLLFATNNQHKIQEIQSAIGDRLKVTGLKEAGINIDIPEPHNTLEENAKEKSSVIYALTGKNCFSEDTGLEVYALNGEPGVRSARYAGGRSDSDNIEKLLKNLKNAPSRKARFRTVISLFWNNKEYLFEGICEGTIAEGTKGTKGFGYDPVFIPEGAEKTFAEMEMNEKNSYSHRKKAASQMVVFLQTVI
ncbi:MAG: RdgB/HAM1 family non-canonical purine NTP pyrophosphatase [Chitinophagaceae bacterium]|nr:RdgB/HAM1 family non-canonical purine NTP pyrophosphatase [Chitinophagaceae bacterium]